LSVKHFRPQKFSGTYVSTLSNFDQVVAVQTNYKSNFIIDYKGKALILIILL